MTRIQSMFGAALSATWLVAVPAAALAQDDAGGAPAVEIKPRPAEIMPLAVSDLLLDVHQVDGGFVAVGDRGGVLLSEGGTEWRQVEVPVRAALTAVDFVDTATGWAVGHDAAILKTSDGGGTWSRQQFLPDLEMPLLDVYAVDADRAFAIGAYGLFFETTDGGATWADKEEGAEAVRAEEYHLNMMVGLNNGDLFIAGEFGTLGVSADEGVTWEGVTSPYESSLFGALPWGERGVLVYGLRSNIFVTEDPRAGDWTQVETDSVSSMFGGTVLADGRLALVGLNGVVVIVGEGGVEQVLQTPNGTSLSAATWAVDRLLAVGESGVQSIALP